LNINDFIIEREKQYKNIAHSTSEQYLKTYYRLVRDDLSPEQVAHTKKSFEKYRASLVYSIYRAIIHSPEKIEMLFNEVKPYLDGTITWSKLPKSQKTKAGSTSKKAIYKLPMQWKEKMFSAATVRMKLILATMELTGCRPVAFAKNGVSLSIKNKIIYAEFLPGKRDQDAGKGQDWVKLGYKLNPENPRISYLARWISGAGNGALKVASDNVSESTIYIAKKVFPRSKAQ